MSVIAIQHVGMATGVGLSAPASCAAIRARITAFHETAFFFDGEPIVGGMVPLAHNPRGREKILDLAALAAREALEGTPCAASDVPILLVTAEEDRPGRFAGLDETLLPDLARRLEISAHPSSQVICEGRIGGVHALVRADGLLRAGSPACLVVGVDTLLVARTLESLHDNRRLLTAKHSNGLIPGEAGAALLVTRPGEGDNAQSVLCTGVGFAREEASVLSGLPLRAQGLVEAIRAAMDVAGATFDDVDVRISDVQGEQYGFREAALAAQRLMRERKPEFDLWHPADCIGSVGAATLPVLIGIAQDAWVKRYAPGPGAMVHLGDDHHERAALILRTADTGAW